MEKENRKYFRFYLSILAIICFPCICGARALQIPDSYQIQTATVIDSRNQPDQDICDEKAPLAKYVYVAARGPIGLVNKLNALGRCGYRLLTLTKSPLKAGESIIGMRLVAILSLTPGDQFDYEWFAAVTTADVETQINLRAEKGFVYREKLPTAQGLCDDGPDETSETTENDKILNRANGFLSFSVGDIYFVERQKNVEYRKEYKVVSGLTGRGRKPTEELQNGLDEFVKSGFRPVAMGYYKALNAYAIGVLLQRTVGSTTATDTIPQYKFLSSESGFEKKINALAKEGFRLAFVGEEGGLRDALMVSGPNAIASEYFWVDTLSKSYSRKLMDLAKQGAAVSATESRTYGCDLAESQLVLRSVTGAKARPTEFRILDLNADFDRWQAMDPRPFVMPLSGESMKESQDLLDKGFQIRDLFYSKRFSVLFEYTSTGVAN